MIIRKTSDSPEVLSRALAIFNDSIYVDMHYEGKSKDIPLFSDHFANCLAVVIHDAKNCCGYLLHIFPGSAGGTNIYALFHFVDRQIDNILAELDKSAKINIFLWKGISYTPQVLDHLTMSYAEYAKKRYQHTAVIIDLMDGKKITFESKLLYHPLSGEIFIIDYKHSNLFPNTHLKKSNQKLSFCSENKITASIIQEISVILKRGTLSHFIPLNQHDFGFFPSQRNDDLNDTKNERVLFFPYR